MCFFLRAMHNKNLKCMALTLAMKNREMGLWYQEMGVWGLLFLGGRIFGKLSSLRTWMADHRPAELCLSGDGSEAQHYRHLGTLWGHFGVILCCGGCSVHCRVFSNIPGLYPWDANSTCFSPVTTTDISRRWQMSPRSHSHPGLRTSALGKEVGKQNISTVFALCVWWRVTRNRWA